jgi:hypothetical protein
MNDIDALSLRDLQKECSRALAVWRLGNKDLHVFTRQAHHDSQGFYRAVIRRYVEEHGGLPSRTGPGAALILAFENDQ